MVTFFSKKDKQTSTNFNYGENPLKPHSPPPPPPIPLSKDEKKELEKKLTKIKDDLKKFKKIAKSDIDTALPISRHLIIKINEVLDDKRSLPDNSNERKEFLKCKDMLIVYITNMEKLKEFKSKWS